jgi:hypothetical protein
MLYWSARSLNNDTVSPCKRSSQFTPISSACPYREKTFVLMALLNSSLVSLPKAWRPAADETNGSVVL